MPLSPVRNDSFLAVFLNCWIGKDNMFYSQRENEKVAAAGLAQCSLDHEDHQLHTGLKAFQNSPQKHLFSLRLTTPGFIGHEISVYQ